jgi:2,4-dienoyl-CoA reductase-like NADH-dependent reductase (Old Yellow Enzyme family)
MELKTLFSPEKIGNVQIKNRIVRSATYMGYAEKYGYVGKDHIKIYIDLARGGTGLIISGYIAMDPSGTGSPYQICLYNDSFMPGQRKLVEAVHEYADVKIAAQIGHTGRQGSHPKYPPVAPSPIPDKMTKLTPRELTADEISEFVKRFVDTSRRAYECGYDMIQFHAGHGYLLSNFLSPYTNLRTDEYGGSTQNRTKILVDLYNQLRDEVGKNFPITIKMQTVDGVPNGLILEEAIEIAKILVNTGYDAIEPSGGLAETQITSKNALPSKIIKSPEDENYFLPMAKKLKPIMNKCRLILIGGIKNPLSAEKILQEKTADFISMCRPLIYEPNLPNRWKSGDLTPALCKSCNSCFMTMLKGSVYCVVKKKLEEKKLRIEKRSVK